MMSRWKVNSSRWTRSPLTLEAVAAAAESPATADLIDTVARRRRP